MAMTYQRVQAAFDACLAVVNENGTSMCTVTALLPARMEDPTLRSFEVSREVVWAHLAFVCETGKVLAAEAAQFQKEGFMMLEVDESPIAGEERLRAAKSRMEKAMRWLGFVQGALWMGVNDTYVSLEELKKMNMPSEETFDGEKV